MCEPISIYIHVPFCMRKCGYCVFNSQPLDDPRDLERLTAGVIGELALRRAVTGPREARTVYFGGGTPSLLSAEQIGRMLREAGKLFPIAADAEITVEANPTSQPEAETWLRVVRAAGVNRLSIGAQSFRADALRTLDRCLAPEDTVRFVAAARAAGFGNVSVDLIFGIPGSMVADWQQDIGAAIGLGPDHVSIYALEIHGGTPLAAAMAGGGAPREVTDEDESAMYYEAARMLEGAGLAQYEISNFARPGRESRHNLNYWRGGDYLGIGPGAAGHVAGTRMMNIGEFREWERAVGEHTLPTAWAERLSTPRRIRELAVMRMRLREGVDTKIYEEAFGERLSAKLYEDCASLGPRLERAGDYGFRVPTELQFTSNDILSRIVL